LAIKNDQSRHAAMLLHRITRANQIEVRSNTTLFQGQFQASSKMKPRENGTTSYQPSKKVPLNNELHDYSSEYATPSYPYHPSSPRRTLNEYFASQQAQASGNSIYWLWI
jgi:hypothetical protein